MTLCDVIETFVVLGVVFPCPSSVEVQIVRHDHYFVMLLILQSCQILSCQMRSGFLEQVTIKCFTGKFPVRSYFIYSGRIYSESGNIRYPNQATKWLSQHRVTL